MCAWKIGVPIRDPAKKSCLNLKILLHECTMNLLVCKYGWLIHASVYSGKCLFVSLSLLGLTPAAECRSQGRRRPACHRAEDDRRARPGGGKQLPHRPFGLPDFT
jgi:hypothetical protein